MRIPNSVRAPGPTAGILGRRGFLVLIEAREIHAPHIAIARRQGAAVGFRQPLHSLPWEGKLDGPAAIAVVVFVDRAVDGHGGFLSWKMPIERAEPRTAWM